MNIKDLEILRDGHGTLIGFACAICNSKWDHGRNMIHNVGCEYRKDEDQ